MNGFIDELSRMREYSEELKNALKIIVPAMVEYYGIEYEVLICEAISSATIYQCQKNETIYDVVKKFDITATNENDIVKEGDLKRASGVNLSVPNISYADGIYNLDSVTRVVAISSIADLDTDFGKSTLIHELGHLIKSYNNEYAIEDDVVISRSGFSETRSKLSVLDDGTVTKSTIVDKNVGLEEGINSYDEANILALINKTEVKYRAYAVESSIVDNLINSTGLRQDIIESQLTGDTSIFINKYNENSDTNLFDDLSITMDESVKATYESLSNMFIYISYKEEDKLKVQEINERRSRLYITALNNIEKRNSIKSDIGFQSK